MSSSPIALESQPPITNQLAQQVEGPSEIDGECDELGVPAILANYHLATPVNLSFLNMGLEQGVYIPRQISTREGGRKSQYDLAVGESVLAGVVAACGGGMMLRHVTRVTGSTQHAETGDLYREQWKSRNGELIYEGEGTLEIIDSSIGKARYVLRQTITDQYAQEATDTTKVWVLWSCILVEN